MVVIDKSKAIVIATTSINKRALRFQVDKFGLIRWNIIISLIFVQYCYKSIFILISLSDYYIIYINGIGKCYCQGLY